MRTIKRLTAFIVILAALAVTAYAQEATETPTQPETNYMGEMIQAATKGATAWGTAAQEARDAKIDTESIPLPKINYNDLYLLAKIIYAEAGSNWISDDWKMAVGEVLINRTNSPEFADTIADCIYSPGQYYRKSNKYFANLKPSERCVLIAKRLLEGERYFYNDAVVFQAEFRQGSGVAAQFSHKGSGTTYFCYSSHRELYN